MRLTWGTHPNLERPVLLKEWLILLLVVCIPFQHHLELCHMHYAHLYCASRSCVNAHLAVWRNSCEEDSKEGRVFLSAEILCFSTVGKSWEVTTFYHMASKIKPGRGLRTKLTTNILGWLSGSCLWMRDLKCLDPMIFPWLMSAHFCSLLLLFSMILNRRLLWWSQCYFVFFLSLLGYHDSVSLCVVFLNKVPFVYDFVIILM